MPYLHWSFSAKEPYNQWIFCGKWRASYKTSYGSSPPCTRDLSMFPVETWYSTLQGKYWQFACMSFALDTDWLAEYQNILSFIGLFCKRDLLTHTHTHIDTDLTGLLSSHTLIERNPPPPGGFPLYYVSSSRTVCNRPPSKDLWEDKLLSSHNKQVK